MTETGRLFAEGKRIAEGLVEGLRLGDYGRARAIVSGEDAEMIIRMAEAAELPFAATPVDDDWLDVTIGRFPL